MSEITLQFAERKEESLARRTVQDISDVKKLKCYAKQIDQSLSCPFGHITEDAIGKARDILGACEKNVQELEKVLAKENHTDADVLKVLDATRSLTSEFYNTFPSTEFEYGSVRILENLDEINRARECLNRMSEVEVATRLLTASAYRKDVDRISYIMEGLECRFTEMTPLDAMSQKILRFIYATGGSCWKIKGILALTPRSATINFDKYCNDENQMYLWHGTKAVNLMSILKDGFLVNPPHSSITGRLFGDVSHDLLRI
ncbi:unnamed protein product [Heligmosomoides polygyrus]|uniref:PARP alpha-helical domain-containing protein n=1 Tax=Heligmosomoides polygyrus TaxID=6339 RepID=A0A3P7UVC7_HELPZ|nr:unnamed protein product [Heligmosomoides polygyrus]